MRSRRAVSSVRRVSAWLIVAAGLALYGALVYVLGMARLSPSLPLPWWAALAVPPILYALVIRLFVGRVSILRWVCGTLCLWAAHVLLGALTAALAADLAPLSVDLAAVDALAPPVVPGIFWVPLLLLPFRDLIGGHPPKPLRRQTPDRPARAVRHNAVPISASHAQQAAPAKVRPGISSQPPTPGRAPSTERPMPGGLRSRETGSGPRPSPVQRGPAAGSAKPNAPDRGIDSARDAASPPPHRLHEEPAHDAPAVLVRISFDRVAEQFPPGAFRVPLDRVGASLQEPGHLLIPQRLVVAQLAEGLVRAGWEVVVEQFPRDVLAMTDEEINRRLPDGQLLLPLDELVPQLPVDLFAPTGQPVDIERIASIPAPFQPFLSEDSDTPSVVVAQAVTESAASKAAGAFDDEKRVDDHPAAIAVLEDVVQLEPGPVGAAGVQSDPMPAIDTPRRPRRASPGDFVPGPRPVRGGTTPGASTPDPMPQPVDAVPERDGIAARRSRVTVALAPFRPLAVGVESADGTTLFTVTASDLAAGAVHTAATLLLPLLDEGRAPWPVNQLTMRSADIALILTPLGPPGPGGSVLLCAVPPGGALASLERLCLRAVAEPAREGSEVSRIDRAEAEPLQEPDLLDSEPATRVHQIAATLGALGPVTASVLHDAEADRDLYLFLPPESDVRGTGRFAGELDRAACKIAEAGYAFHTAVLRCGRRRLIIRREHTSTGPAVIVVVGGETDRPGLAYRQAEGAALALSAR